MRDVHWLVTSVIGLVMALLALFFAFSFVVGLSLVVDGRFHDWPGWQVGLYLMLLALHAAVFGCGHVAAVRSLWRRRAAKAHAPRALGSHGIFSARAS